MVVVDSEDSVGESGAPIVAVGEFVGVRSVVDFFTGVTGEMGVVPFVEGSEREEVEVSAKRYTVSHVYLTISSTRRRRVPSFSSSATGDIE